ncbi:MAG: hypothetical protein LWW94_08570 [Candidatus Desulfofervidaceae bacterium]|nr:hypothetical protein [Candidatus Desulfofervidaceae bacterium]
MLPLKQLKQQVVSFELAKELKKLGVPQESLFYWLEDTYFETVHLLARNEVPHPLPSHEQVYSAFTVAELLKLFPEEWDIVFTKRSNGYW